MQPESTIKRCEHSVYDPNDDQRFCTVCTPTKIVGEVLKRIKTTVGTLTLVVESGSPSEMQLADHDNKREWVKWNATLEAYGLGMTKGADAEDSVAIAEYFIDREVLVADEEVSRGFQLVSIHRKE